jgi:hypothetical protein
MTDTHAAPLPCYKPLFEAGMVAERGYGGVTCFPSEFSSPQKYFSEFIVPKLKMSSFIYLEVGEINAHTIT